MNKLHRLLMLIVLLMISMASFGQEGKVNQMQIAIEDYDKVDTCEITRYATVRKDGKWGIYDLERKENVTEVDMDMIMFSRFHVSEDGVRVCYFYAEKGYKCANIGVIMDNNQQVAVWKDNSKYIADLSRCTTIDSTLSSRCRLLLSESLTQINGDYGQIAIIDANSGHLKTWVASSKQGSGYEESPILLNSCSINAMSPFLLKLMLGQTGRTLDSTVETSDGTLTCRQLIEQGKEHLLLIDTTDDKKPFEEKMKELKNDITAGDALMLACSMTGIGNGGRFMHPTLQEDEVTCEEDELLSPDAMREIRSLYKMESPNIAGRYSVVTNAVRYDGSGPVDEMCFAGFMPSDKPKYAICVFLNKPSGGNSDTKQLSRIVNRLTEWLNM